MGFGLAGWGSVAQATSAGTSLSLDDFHNETRGGIIAFPSWQGQDSDAIAVNRCKGANNIIYNSNNLEADFMLKSV